MNDVARGIGKEAIALTQTLVRINSENPLHSEAEIASYVCDWLSELPRGSVVTQLVEDHRPNVIATLPAESNEPPLVYIAHMDTVPIGDHWTKDPLGGEIIDGKLYGRGACDMKSGLAVAMTSFAAVARSDCTLRRPFVVIASVDEEGAMMRGVNALVDEGMISSQHLVIATEPSDLEVVTAHKGLAWIEVEFRGRLAHAGNPEVGVDAVRAGAEFITLIKREIDDLPHDHPLLGRTEVTFSRFEGGIKTNVVPDYARIELDVRIPLPLGLEDINAIVNRCCSKVEEIVPGVRTSFRRFNNERPPVEADAEGDFARSLLVNLEQETGAPGRTSVFPAYTDASVVQARTGNHNCLVFGPGRLQEAHTVDEFVSVDQIDKAASVLTQLAFDLCMAKADG